MCFAIYLFCFRCLVQSICFGTNRLFEQSFLICLLPCRFVAVSPHYPPTHHPPLPRLPPWSTIHPWQVFQIEWALFLSCRGQSCFGTTCPKQSTGPYVLPYRRLWLITPMYNWCFACLFELSLKLLLDSTLFLYFFRLEMFFIRDLLTSRHGFFKVFLCRPEGILLQNRPETC